jgi:predicted ATPase/DNA-binding CsgD family transcriptional regulator
MEMSSDLPVGVAAFVGRERERAEVGELVAEMRVATLTGSGGCGKTRLAMEVAGDVASRFSDGVCWVDLAGVSEPAMVAPAIAAAMGVRGRSGESLADALTEQARIRHLLVVLDNCEHLLAACARLVSRLSSACPRLHVLATSREPLAVEGEVLFQLSPLAVPAAGARSTSAVAASDAAKLFEVRARKLGTGFRISDDNALDVAEICRRLDGLPLAIELAAARVRVLAPAQITVGLSHRFGLLTGGLRDAPPRHQTLEASLDWSYELLDQEQQLTLARLSVFSASFEFDAAEAVVAADGIGTNDVLGLIAALVERSLLQVTERDGRARYRLLETIRVYARQRLTELDDPNRVRDRHLAFYVGLVSTAEAGLTGAHPEPWTARLAADLDDLRAAMAWAVVSRDPRGLVDIAEPIMRFWFDHGLSAEMQRRLSAAVDAPAAGEHDRVRGLGTAALLALGNGEPARAHASANQAINAARAADANAPLALGLSIRALSGALSGLADSERVLADVEEAVEHAGQCGEAATHAHVLILAGVALVRTHTIDAGCHLLERAIEVCEASEVTFHLLSAHVCLGVWPVLTGSLDQTRQHARRGLELSRQVGRPGWEALGLTGLGAADVLQERYDAAKGRLSEAQGQLRQRGLDRTQFAGAVLHWLALCGHASDDAATARTTAETLAAIGRERENRWDEAVGEWLLGTIAHSEDRHDQARTHLERSLARSTDPRLPLPHGRAALGLADLARMRGDLDDAWKLAHDGLQVLAAYGDRVGSAGALDAIAELAVTRGKPEQALRLLAASQRFHTEAGIERFPLESDRFGRADDAARAALDDAEAAECWEEGGRLILADAIAYARRGWGERDRPQSGWASLSPAEVDLVRLVAQGFTNAEIGEHLFISVNTVKKHLTHVYAKVDVDGRAALAAEVTRREL